MLFNIYNFYAMKKTGANALLSVLLLLLYMVGNIQPEVLHSLSHNHGQAELHTVQAEKDPCHRSLYHAAREKGCEHTAHFTASKKCAACHLISHAAHLASSSEGNTDYTVAVSYDAIRTYIGCVIDLSLLSSRAPPVA
jgi:hypothetical protein